MTQVIPAIIAKSFEELQEKIDKVSPYTNWIQIDISDGIYTPNITWNNPKDLQNLKSDANLEIHLMIVNPENYITNWIKTGVKRIIVHVSKKEDYQKILNILKLLKNKNIELGIGIDPKVSFEDIKEIIPLVQTVLLLAVNPGFSGQEFQPIVLERIKKLYALFPNIKIEVDGGINLKTAKKCILSGAHILVSGSYIFNSKNIKEAIELLKQ